MSDKNHQKWHKHKTAPFRYVNYIVQCPHNQLLAWSDIDGMYKYEAYATKWKLLYNNNDPLVQRVLNNADEADYFEKTNIIRIYDNQGFGYHFVNIDLNKDCQQLKFETRDSKERITKLILVHFTMIIGFMQRTMPGILIG